MGIEKFGLTTMYKIEIIVGGEVKSMVSTILKDVGISGFTIINNVSGYGHGGYHEGRSLYNDINNQVMFVAVGVEEVIKQIVKSMNVFFSKNSGVMFVSNVAITRPDYFLKENVDDKNV